MKVVKRNRHSWINEDEIIKSDKGKLLGFITEIHLSTGPELGEPTVFVVTQCYDKQYNRKVVNTKLEAYHYLGVSTEEVDKYYDFYAENTSHENF